MQLTLVSHYGEKSRQFALLLRDLQKEVTSALGPAFQPYDLEQIHGTIIGLEGALRHGQVRSANRRRLLGEERCFDFAGMVEFLRGELAGFQVQIGGFREAANHGFLSQGQSPFHRSFSIQGGSVVVMGWPEREAEGSQRLDELRRRLEDWGALRKWAWRKGEVDNDFYFVLGQIDDPLSEILRHQIERRMRRRLARMTPTGLSIRREALAFVAYTDPRLPAETSRVFRIDDGATTGEALASVYDVT